MTEIAVVVIGRNEGERLVACLKSLGTTGCRVIYVDSGSTDCSPAVAAAHGALVVELNPSIPFTAARARNAGLDYLQTFDPLPAYVQFIDGDCVLADGWLNTARAFLHARSDVAIVCGRRRERYPDFSVYNQLCDIEWDTAIGKAQECGGDSLVRLGALRSAGAFDGTLIAGEEPELCVRLRACGWAIWRLDAEMTVHDANMTRLSQWWRRSSRAGYAFAEVSLRHRTSPAGIWRKSVRRALFWGAGLPVAIILIALSHPGGLLLAFAYPLQITRIAFRRGARYRTSWIYGSFAMLSKFSEAQGIVRFYSMSLAGRRSQLLEYK